MKGFLFFSSDHRISFTPCLITGISLLWHCCTRPLQAEEIPARAQRPVVVQMDPAEAKGWSKQMGKVHLPEGYELQIVAAPPLVTHPMMACVDERGRLFVGDAVGVNWNKDQLEANPPNRILMLEDTDRDSFYDKSTIFADKMTFPQGGQWLNGSLYVASPPGIWKLTDTNDDGVADQREMIVSGFDYTGNAADVHGPFLHPNGRLYWCHGRKGYRVTDKGGRVLHEGKSSGIWSAKPDGSDVQWHSLLAGDNPVEVDFTPQGDLIGVQNLYYSQPRGDTIVHWLYGGVYERADQMQVIAGQPRTLDKMPVMYDFGHVAVSGSCFWKSYAERSANDDQTLQYLVTHFNTQRLVRMELTPHGSSYQARENEFLKLEDPDVHFTDVLEDHDGSLLVINTGGWFRIGCPASLMAKPDILGSVYRVRRTSSATASTSGPWKVAYQPVALNKQSILSGLAHEDPQVRLRTLSAIAENHHHDHDISTQLLAMMEEELDPPQEHALLFAAQKLAIVDSVSKLQQVSSPVALRRLLISYHPKDDAEIKQVIQLILPHLDSSDESLAKVTLNYLVARSDHNDQLIPLLQSWLKQEQLSEQRLRALQGYTSALLSKQEVQQLLTVMLNHDSAHVRRIAMETLAGQNLGISHPDWLAAFDQALSDHNGPTPLQLDALKKLKTSKLDAKLQAIANDANRPTTLRLKALAAMHSLQLNEPTFGLLHEVLTKDASAAARIQSAIMLRSGKLSREQLATLSSAFASVGPIELKEMIPLVRQAKDEEMAQQIAAHLAKNPALISQQESVYRTAFSSHPPSIMEQIIHPAYRAGEQAIEARKRLIEPLTEKVIAKGNAKAGRELFEASKGACIACHQIGDLGRPIGPNLSTIGAIRTERDLIESILFPSNTLARDYETHLIETHDGQTLMGVIRSHTADGLLVVDVAGQEKNLPHETIISNTTLEDSLMPMGLESTMSEQELLDLIAWLRSLK